MPGHWEGDLIIGAGGRSAVGHPGRAFHPLRPALVPRRRQDSGQRGHRDGKAMGTLPAELAGAVTWDQGTEMNQHATFTIGHRNRRLFLRSPQSRGSAAPTRTPTGCCANTCQREPTSPSTAPADLAAIRAKPQQPSPQDPWIYETIRETRRASCAHRLNPPIRTVRSCEVCESCALDERQRALDRLAAICLGGASALRPSTGRAMTASDGLEQGNARRA